MSFLKILCGHSQSSIFSSLYFISCCIKTIVLKHSSSKNFVGEISADLILFSVLTGSKKMASYFAVCFVILTVSLCFLEFRMRELLEAWGKAIFLPRKLFPSTNCLRCHNSALLKSNCLPKVFFNFCFVCLFSAESERISHIVCIWVTNQYEEGPLVVMNYRRLFYT